MTEKEFLKAYDITEYERPSMTADIVLFALDRAKSNIRSIGIDGLQVLLIRRGAHPYKGRWALPGGFCVKNETIGQTAKRELFEEAGIQDAFLELSGTYSSIGRDPRGWIISNAFTGMACKESCRLRADTDAWDAAWFTFKDYRTETGIREYASCIKRETIHKFSLVNEDGPWDECLDVEVMEEKTAYATYTETAFNEISSSLAFDHGQIICEAYVKARERLRKDVRLLFYLFPEQFTIGELQKGYETFLREPVLNFRRTVSPFVEETENMAPRAGYRPAKLFKRKQNTFLG